MAARVIVLCPNDNTRGAVMQTVRKCNLEPVPCSSYGEARHLLGSHDLAAVFCSDSLNDGDYSEVIETARPVPVIVLSRYAEWEPCLAALDAGAFDYVACPPDVRELERILWFALDRRWRLGQQVAAVA